MHALDPDSLELYRWAVQDPETHAMLLELVYERVRGGRSPEVLREDFAGTSAESVAWVALAEGRRAVAVDRDGATLAWARRRAGVILGEDAARVRFVEGDVRAVAPPEVPEADVIAALNFSVCYLHRRAALVAYLEHARRCLAEMREALREAGFADVQVWRHTHDAAKGEVFLGEVASLDEPGRWTAYMVALR